MAKFDDKMGHIYVPSGKLDAYTAAAIGSMFDQSVFLDERDIVLDKEETDLINKLALAKTVLFPFEYLAFRVFAGERFSRAIMEEQRLYWRFLRKKIDLEQFKLELVKLNKGGY